VSDSTSKSAATDNNAASSFQIFHADHGISEGQMSFIKEKLVAEIEGGFFILEVKIPEDLGAVPSALYGPTAGDDPVEEDQVYYSNRGLDRAWEDRMVDLPARDVDHVQVIGIRDGDAFQVFTCYGGPLAPQHPDDPGNQDPDASREFWAVHALAA
jgi:hypothetical protein